MAKMNVGLFLLDSTLGMTPWAAILAWAGYALGSHYDAVSTFLGPASYVVLGLLATAFLAFLVYRKRRESAATGEQSARFHLTCDSATSSVTAS